MADMLRRRLRASDLVCRVGGETLEQLMDTGDKRLYQAKQAGRDRVESGPLEG